MDLTARFVSRPDYRQLSSYARVMERIGWDVVPLDGQYLFLRRIGPISIAKFQRPAKVDFANLSSLREHLPIFRLYIDPGLSVDLQQLRSHGFKETRNHYAYTKTLICDLRKTENQIFASFSRSLRYRMHKSLRMSVEYQTVSFSEMTVKLKTEVIELQREWEKEKKVSGYSEDFLHAMWEEMPEHGHMILAYHRNKLHGLMYVLHHHQIGMYFYQNSSILGRDELSIPSGLAYYCVKLAFSLGCDTFDLCSAYDERYGNEHIAWKGFTKHKETFHPTPIYYPPSFV